MPLYFAQKRKSPVGFTNQGETSFVRADPSRFRYFAFSTPTSHVSTFFTYFAAATMAIWYGLVHRTNATIKAYQYRTTFINHKKADMLPFKNPVGIVSLPTSYKMTRPVSDMFAKYNALSPIKIFRGKAQFMVNELDGLANADLPLFLSLSLHSSKTFTATAGTLTPGGYRFYLELLSILTTVTGSMWWGIHTSGDNAGRCRLGVITGDKNVNQSFKDVPEVVEEDINDITTVESNVTTRDDQHDDAPVFMTRHIEAVMAKPWGSAGDYAMPIGLTLPFRRDYSNPDSGIFSQFVRAFPSVFDKATLDESADDAVEYLSVMEKWWRDEISATPQGEWMAHLMKSLVLAKECSTSLWVSVVDGHYQGSILGGGKWQVVVDRTVYRPLSDAAFQKDLSDMDVHMYTMERILDLMKVPKPRAVPTSLRRLREMAITMPLTGSEKNSISELLPSLIFTVDPVSINPTTLLETARLLTDENREIPIYEYLPVTEFWSEDRYRLVLGRYGRRAPTFNTGPELTRFSRSAHGVGITKAPPFNSSSPTNFQVEFIPLNAAVLTWRRLITYGLQNITSAKELTSAHMLFRGRSAQDLWTHLTTIVTDKIEAMRAQGAGSSDVGGDKRGRDDDEEGEEEGEIPTLKKKAKFSMF